MKYIVTSIFIIWLSLAAAAQSPMDDVIYLKNGSIYRGFIMNENPGRNYIMRIYGGTVIKIEAAEVEKITKEPRIIVPPRPKPPFHYRDKGYFILGEAHFGIEYGFNIVNGYKFGQYGMLGIGGGVDWVLGQPWSANSGYTAGAYAPVYIYYGGDMLRRKITPFYALYAGYGFCFLLPYYITDGISGGTQTTTVVQGGPMGGCELGVRFYTRHRINVTLGLNLTIQSTIFWSNSTSGYIFSTNTSQTYASGAVVMYIPTFNFGIGF
jgi:hypothetical protein